MMRKINGVNTACSSRSTEVLRRVCLTALNDLSEALAPFRVIKHRAGHDRLLAGFPSDTLRVVLHSE
jgi:hypothetical protein